MKSKTRNSKVFKRFLMSYLLILLIPLTLFVFILKRTTYSMEQSAKDNNIVLLRQAQSVIDSRMKRIYHAITNISYNSAVNNAISSEKNISKDIDSYFALAKDLSAFNQADEQIYIYSPLSDALLSSHGCYSYLDKIYGSVLAYDNLDFKKFHREFLNGKFRNQLFPAKPAIVNSESSRYILYMQSLPLNSDIGTLGNVIYFIKESSILKYLEGLQISDGGFACIVTPDNTVVTGIGNIAENPLSLLGQNKNGYSEQTIQGEKLLVTSVQSAYNDWVYIAAVPKKVVLRDADSIKFTISILILLYMLFGIIVSCAFAVKNFKPLKEVFTLIKESIDENQNDGDEYELLTQYVENLNQDNRRLSRSLDGYLPMIESSLISRLLRGEFNTLDEIEDYLGSKPDLVCYSLYCAAVIDIHSQLTGIDETTLNDLTVRRVIIKEAIGELVNDFIVFSDVDMSKIGILFFTGEKNDSDLIKQIKIFLEKLLDKIPCKYRSGVSMGVGNGCRGVLQASFSYLQANEALRMAIKKKETYRFYDTHSDTEEGFYFPDALAMGLAQAVENGNIKQVKNTLKILDVENFQRRNLPEDNAKDLLECVRLTISKIDGVGNVMVPDTIQDSHDKFYYYSKELLSACNASSNLIYDRNKGLHNEILGFIDKNYNNSDLCLALIASKFGLSQPYVSHLLKKSFGVNFSTYLEAKRIEQATKLLHKGKYAIENVAEMVGYNSPHSFRRAFKKVTKINPSDMRKRNVPYKIES